MNKGACSGVKEAMNLHLMKHATHFIGIVAFVLVAAQCSNGQPAAGETREIPSDDMLNVDNQSIDTVVFGEGCFWCTEAIFQELKGVIRVESGYSGGDTENPTYEEVCTGTTGHAEVTFIEYDTSVISFDKLLEVFWKTHDPTTLNRQGADIGTQYRSVIFFTNEAQRETAESYKEKLDSAGIWNEPIVTEITPFKDFYKAEDYHQDYYENNRSQGYCRLVITPKLEKFRAVFSEDLR